MDVFILGAGFSKSISERMPVLGELRNCFEDINTDYLPAKIRDLTDFEQLLTYLSSPAAFVSPADAKRGEATFFEVAEAIGTSIDEREASALHEHSSGPPKWLTSLVSAWRSTGAAVLTFNYDTLIELVLSDAGDQCANPRDYYPLPPKPSGRGSAAVDSDLT